MGRKADLVKRGHMFALNAGAEAEGAASSTLRALAPLRIAWNLYPCLGEYVCAPCADGFEAVRDKYGTR